ncbi:hypothetical protein ACLOJK_010120 [Asimina triloba]
MAASRFSFGAFAVVALFFGIVLPAVQAQSLAPAPTPTSDDPFESQTFLAVHSLFLWSMAKICFVLFGTSIDQGIAYLLMLVALVLTYLIHPLDASSSYGWMSLPLELIGSCIAFLSTVSRPSKRVETACARSRAETPSNFEFQLGLALGIACPCPLIKTNLGD